MIHAIIAVSSSVAVLSQAIISPGVYMQLPPWVPLVLSGLSVVIDFFQVVSSNTCPSVPFVNSTCPLGDKVSEDASVSWYFAAVAVGCAVGFVAGRRVYHTPPCALDSERDSAPIGRSASGAAQPDSPSAVGSATRRLSPEEINARGRAQALAALRARQQ